MGKTASLAEIQPHPRAAQSEPKARRRASASLVQRAKAATAELGALPMKPLLIGAGIGAALLGSALVVTKRSSASGASPFAGMNQTLTKTALIALARVVSGQTVRSVAASALLDVADALKT